METRVTRTTVDKLIEHVSDYEWERIKNIRENNTYLRRLLEPAKQRSDNPKKRHDKRPKTSSNNCGIHTILYIMNHCKSGVKLSMSPSQIDTHSIRIRAWLIKMIVEGLSKGKPWAQSLKAHISMNMENN